MEKISPANYLNVDNFERYRRIMRYFYKRHRQMQGALYRPDIIKMMQTDYLSSYGDLEVDQDLENLVLWGNLQRQQEMLRPKSIEEYRNRNFRYQITEAGILVEEMVYQLTHTKHAAIGALDEKGFRKLLQLLTSLLSNDGDPVDLWKKIETEFRKIGADTANYIGYITSPEVDSRMKTEQFLVYKDKFINYLREFISNVQSLYHQFVAVINRLPQLDAERLIDGLFEKAQEIPTMDATERTEVEEQVLGVLSALQNWFIGTPERPSEYDNLMLQTDQMITKITGLIYYYGQEIHQYQSRRKDYLHMAEWFSQVKNLAEAQEMYAGIFGLEHTRHFYVTESSDATSNRENSWELSPSTLFLNKRGRGARTERKAQSFKLDRTKQKKQFEIYQKKAAEHREKIESYFLNNQLDFSTIKQLDSESRKVFLKWISGAVATQVPNKIATGNYLEQVIATELNFDVRIKIDLGTQIYVNCDDGCLQMPQVTIERIIS